MQAPVPASTSTPDNPSAVPPPANPLPSPLSDLDNICNDPFTEEEMWVALRKLKAGVSTIGDSIAITVKLLSAHTVVQRS